MSNTMPTVLERNKHALGHPLFPQPGYEIILNTGGMSERRPLASSYLRLAVVLPITTRPAERRGRADPVGRRFAVPGDRGHGLRVIDASTMSTAVRAK